MPMYSYWLIIWLHSQLKYYCNPAYALYAFLSLIVQYKAFSLFKGTSDKSRAGQEILQDQIISNDQMEPFVGVVTWNTRLPWLLNPHKAPLDWQDVLVFVKAWTLPSHRSPWLTPYQPLSFPLSKPPAFHLAPIYLNHYHTEKKVLFQYYLKT